MTLAAVVAIFVLTIVWLAAKDHMIADEREAWAEERRELLNRIQHPEVVVPLTAPDREVVETEPDEINLVGEIVVD